MLANIFLDLSKFLLVGKGGNYLKWLLVEVAFKWIFKKNGFLGSSPLRGEFRGILKIASTITFVSHANRRVRSSPKRYTIFRTLSLIL